ncbi:MAG: nitrous oxide reductase accessory protein NosL [Bacteroidetes bacterium]|nr:nitrous oxide reductase accessory protein NosL [Bacteroidota bacterium]MBK8659111.1 nitrous oxide reductase accessory protein NosL [Bacteroidota bacterium]
MKQLLYRFWVYLLPLCLLLAACQPEEPGIAYGKDMCHLCKMTIMDTKFGAVLVNDKGKQLKFDSGECMVNYLKTDPEFKAERIMMINYTRPATLIDATHGFFLHGGEVRSPMGGQLAAFETRQEAEQLQQQLRGDLVLWADVLQIAF